MKEPATTTYEVVAQTDGPGTPRRVVVSTKDRDYAEAILEQFREASVPVRLEELRLRK